MRADSLLQPAGGGVIEYGAFLERKTQYGGMDGFDPEWMPEFLFGFQAALVEWATRKGRAAIFADCGLGKTPMQLVWAENVQRHTGRPVLILTPLAVAAQTIEEAAKFGIEAAVSRDGSVAGPITVTNYERLHLFDLPAVGLHEEREEARRTLEERCEQAAALVAHGDPAVVWCHLNAEGDLLAKLIPDAQQVSGSDSLERKEELLTAFGHGALRVLITKPKIGAWGLNWQHAAHMTIFPSHSYEQYYQGVRRMWRFGQRRPVVVDMITTEGSKAALANLQRKATQADAMFDRLVAHMSDALTVERATYAVKEKVPAWLSATN